MTLDLAAAETRLAATLARGRVPVTTETQPARARSVVDFHESALDAWLDKLSGDPRFALWLAEQDPPLDELPYAATVEKIAAWYWTGA